MIDLHTHILYGIDDGPATLAGSLEIARVAIADGITTMAATPHGRRAGTTSRYSVALLHQRLAELRAALAEAALPLELVPGTELFCDSDLPARLKAGELLPYGTSHTVLVEFPNNALISAVEHMAFALQGAGYRALVAHPERLKVVQENPNLLLPLVERGVCTQLTAAALIGEQGATMQHLAETLVTHRLIHVIASDAHGSHLDRMPLLSAARRRAAALLDEESATALVLSTPAALLADIPLNVPPPRQVARFTRSRKWWW